MPGTSQIFPVKVSCPTEAMSGVHEFIDRADRLVNDTGSAVLYVLVVLKPATANDQNVF